MANYDNNIVNGPDLLSDSQGPMQQNFQALLDLIGVNHVNFNDPDQGKHKFVTHTQNSGPRPLNPGTDKVSYGQRYALTNVTEWLTGNASAAGFVRSSHNIPFSQPMWATLSDRGIVVKTMTVAAINGPARILFPTGGGIPVFTNIVNVQLCVESSGATSPINGSAYIQSFDNLGVNVRIYSNIANNSSAFGFFIVAIGTVGPVF